MKKRQTLPVVEENATSLDIDSDSSIFWYRSRARRRHESATEVDGCSQSGDGIENWYNDGSGEGGGGHLDGNGVGIDRRQYS
jgi:hypothetical protein